MEQIKAFAVKSQEFVLANPIPSVLVAIIILLLIVIFVLKIEGFEGVTEGLVSLAEYPASFAQQLVPDFVKDAVYDNAFVPSTETVVPYEIPSSYMELPTHSVSVPIDIGNGLAVEAKIQVPSQSVMVPTQVPVVLPAPQTSDVSVQAQSVQIPAQSGIIPGKVEESGAVMSIPVDIPAQVVQIPEQKAIIPVMEPFRM